MAGSKASSPDDKGKDDVAAGEKRQIDHESPDTKRAKTEKDGTLEEYGFNSDEKAEEQPKTESEEAKPDKADKTDKAEAKSEGKDGAVQPSEESNVPSSTLEKGIAYFFIRGRVNIQEPEQVDDIARSYVVLRPIPKDARLGEGPIGDAGNSRLVALPKKVFPTSGKDRFMTFVDMSKASFKTLKDDFLASSDYETKTAGTRHTPAATPVAEGVYAITSTGRESHLAYMLTLPEKLDEVQKELGLKKQGSFIISTKNPRYPGPANAQLPKGPEFPDEQEEFRNLRWMPSKPDHFNYVNAQILLIGEKSLEKATEPQNEEEKKGKDSKEVLENLEEDDLERMQQLGGNDSESIFADLHVRAKDYPALQTTF